jgi:hypothetical protein
MSRLDLEPGEDRPPELLEWEEAVQLGMARVFAKRLEREVLGLSPLSPADERAILER